MSSKLSFRLFPQPSGELDIGYASQGRFLTLPERVELLQQGRQKLLNEEKGQYQRREITEGARSGAAATGGLVTTGFGLDFALRRIQDNLKAAREQEVIGEGFAALRDAGLSNYTPAQREALNAIEEVSGPLIPESAAQKFRETLFSIDKTPVFPESTQIRLNADVADAGLTQFIARNPTKEEIAPFSDVLERVFDLPDSTGFQKQVGLTDALGEKMTLNEFQDLYQQRFRNKHRDINPALRNFTTAVGATVAQEDPGVLGIRTLHMHSKQVPGTFESISDTVLDKLHGVGRWMESPVSKRVKVPRALAAVAGGALVGGGLEALRNRGKMKRLRELASQTPEETAEELQSGDRSTAMAMIQNVEPDRPMDSALKFLDRRVAGLPAPGSLGMDILLRMNTNFEEP